MTAEVESARLEWEDAHRALAEATHDASLRHQLETVSNELRRRVGGTFTLRELVDEYARADVWVRAALAGRIAQPSSRRIVHGSAGVEMEGGALDE